MMTCIDPPELTDLELIHYLDKDADAMIGSHVIRCPYCRERAEQLAAEQNALRVALFRASCPDSDTLRDYAFGFLSGKETGAVEEHLHLCPHCTHHLVQLRAFVGDISAAEEAVETAAPGPMQRLRWLVAGLAGGGPLAAAPAGIRGDEDGRLFTYETGDLRIDLNILVDARLPERRVIVGSLLGPAIDDAEEGRWTADLWLGPTWMGTEAADDLGSFRFSELAPGRYELIVNGPESKVRVPEFEVR